MDRLSQLRGEAGGSQDSTLDTTSPPSEAFMTANESSSKFYSLSEVDTTFNISTIKHDIPISSIKDVSLASTTAESEGTMSNADELISNLSPIGKKSDILDSYKIDTQIEAANILSGGVAIFDDNDNSYDGHELVIDDNVDVEDKSNSELKQLESLQFKTDENIIESSLISEEADIASKDSEVVLQIDGKNVDAIDIGNGLYLYRKEGQEELAAVQIINDDEQQPSFKFLKVRENAEGNLEVYEEIQVEVSKEVPAKEGKSADKNTPSHVPIKDISKVISDSTCNKVTERKVDTPKKETTSKITEEVTESQETTPDGKSEVNLNGKMMKFSELRKSPVIGTFTPMTYHSTPNKEGIPLTKTMVDQQLHPNRHSDLSNVKKTIEVHTDSCKQKSNEASTKNKDIDDNKLSEISSMDKETTNDLSEKDIIMIEEANQENNVKDTSEILAEAAKTGLNKAEHKHADNKDIMKVSPDTTKEPMELVDNVIESTEKITEKECVKVDNGTKIEEPKINEAENNKEVEKIEENIEIIQVDNETPERKEDPMEFDEENDLMIVETVSAEEETKEIVENTPQIKKNEMQQPEIIKDRIEKIEEKEAAKGDADELIVIEDDDVCVVEEVVQNKEDKSPDNITESEEKVDHVINTKVQEDILNTEIVQLDKDIVDKGSMQAGSTSSSITTRIKSTNGSSFTVDAASTKAEKDSIINPILHIPPESIKDKVSVSTGDIINKDIELDALHKEPKSNFTNPSSNEPKPDVPSKDNEKQIAQPLTSENKQEQAVEQPILPMSKQRQPIKPIDKPKQTDQPSIVFEAKQKQAGQPENTQKQTVQTPSVLTTQMQSVKSPVLSENKEKPAFKSLEVSKEKQKQQIKSPVLSEEKQKQPVKPPLLYEDKQKQASHSTLPKEQLKEVVQPPKTLCPKQIPPTQASVFAVRPDHTPQLPIAPVDKQNKPIQSLELRDASRKDTTKYVAAANVSPLLEQKQQSLATSTIVNEKLIAPAKNVIKTTSTSAYSMNTPTYQKIENKSELPLKKELAKESLATAVQIRVTSDVPATAPHGLGMDKPISVIRIPEIQKNTIQKPIQNTTDKLSDAKYPLTSYRDDKKHTILPVKEGSNQKAKGVMNIEISKVPKLDPAKVNIVSKQDVSSTSNKVASHNVKKNEPKDTKEMPKASEPNPINNNHSAVPFGKWTEANRQEFLNKFKTKTCVTSSSSNQLKNSNDLNRRDVLKKIDSQRSNNALSKTQEVNKLNIKPETAAFSNKPKEIAPESKVQKTETIEVKSKTVTSKNITKVDVVSKTQNEPAQKTTGTSAAVTKKEICQRTGVVQNLIDKTIEGMIHRALVPKAQDEPKQTTTKESSASKVTKPKQTYKPIEQATLDAIEMKMNELHGIPFIERPPHELPQVPLADPKTFPKIDNEKPQIPIKSKVPNLLPFPNKSQQKVGKDSVIEVDSEDEIIEHEPITGDIDLTKKNQIVKPTPKEKLTSTTNTPQVQQDKLTETSKKEPIITEKDFDKFARRNSITYENCLTVNFESKEPHNVIQTVVEKDPNPKSYSRNDPSRADPKSKPYQYQKMRQPNTQPAKSQPSIKYGAANDDASNRNQSKLQKAYQSALTAKRKLATEPPITIIEDKPVKVVFMENVDYGPSQLNVQGQDLSPAKKPLPESDVTISTCDSLDSDMMDSIEDSKSQDEVKTKTKHQRKQVLTPVEEPELELIEPRDLGLEVSPKKKRRNEDDKTEKNLKYPMRKKMYLLSSNAVSEEKITNPVEILKNPLKETVNLNDNGVAHKNPVSALDSLVKAAELIETQTENINNSLTSSNPDSNSSTPVKRGRGRPRKYPLTPDGTVDKSKVLSAPSPQKKPRLIDAKVPKRDTFTDDSESDDEIIKENWTMGKINENIVCPICNKLFRTENVVFKHVKHCTGPSPSRSDSDKRSPRRMRPSQDFDSKSDDMDIDDDKPLITRKETPKKRKSKDSTRKSNDNDDIIVIEDTPIKEIPEKVDERKHHESRKSRAKIPHKNNDLVCEFCGKTFRQLSYLVSHKLQHKKAEPKKPEKETSVPTKSVYICEVCKKEFRKLHHLVQHRIIHNPSSAPVRQSRKSSSEQSENKVDKEPSTSKQNDDPSAGFRCEPCDKSFRKLHHLVEHRETHDGINRQKTTTTLPTKEEKVVEKLVTLHQCDVCKKTFRKLQHLIEHKEQHVETSSEKSEKSDDKSVKSSLSTRDIIHECSLCYMVFPNEHSLNKHTIICQRKKRQSKQLKSADETEGGDELTESPSPDEKIGNVDSPITTLEDSKQEEEKQEPNKMELHKETPVIKMETKIEVSKQKSADPIEISEKEKLPQKSEPSSTEQVNPAKRDFVETVSAKSEALVVPEKIKKLEEKVSAKIHQTPKKKTPIKEKTAIKRLKTTPTPTPVTEDVKPAVESSDDDEVRYMLNPNFQAEEVTAEKVFLKVRAKKRSSLQIERPNSKDLVKRRTSLQHPPKIPRLKPKAVEVTPVKKEIRIPKVEQVPSTDSDDSETTKYSFPSTIPEKPTKPAQDRTPKGSERKTQKKPLADKRKSLSGIAKRKSLGKAVTARHKVSPLKQIKKRTLGVEHRCDCGQLFSSAALLSRHTTLAHTPPRIRRRRSPPPEEKPVIKPAPRKSSIPEKPKQTPASRKSSARSDSSTSTNTKSTKSEVKGKKSIVKVPEPSSDKKTKSEKSESKSSVKARRTPAAHRGVPVPDRMRKLMQKNK